MNNERKSIVIPTYWNFLKLQIVPRHKLTYLEWGDPNNDKVVICVHGLTRNANDFDYLGDTLAKNFRVIAIDMPGRAGSDWFKNKKYYNYNTYIKDIILFMKAHNIKSAYWIGTSMGGLIGMCLATYYPHLIKCMVLNDIGPEMPNTTLPRIKKYTSQEASFDSFDEAADFMKVIFKYFGIREEEHWKHITDSSLVLCPDKKYRLNYDSGVFAKSSRVGKKELLNLWYLWKKVKCPVLLIHGAKSDILLSSTIEKMKKYRDFDLHTVQNAGHAPALVYAKDLKIISNWFENVKV